MLRGESRNNKSAKVPREERTERWEGDLTGDQPREEATEWQCGVNGVSSKFLNFHPHSPRVHLHRPVTAGC